MPGEEAGDKTFAKKLSKLGGVYVNDAFAVSHRADASIGAITKFLPSYAGLLMEKEIQNLDRVMKRYQHPFTLIVGGAKVSDKVGVLTYFWDKADHILLGGGPANTLFVAEGWPVGDSVYDKERVTFMKRFVGLGKIVTPVDTKVRGWMILDIGSRTLGIWGDHIKKSRTIVWNGPIGLFEKRGFETGTISMWRAVLANRRAVTVIGGGETTASLKLLKGVPVPPNIFLSTGGGAMLDYLSGKKLPGIQALK